MSKNQAAKKYCWADLDTDEPMALISRQRVIGEQAMISRVVLQKGCSVPTHVHENEQFACLLSGKLKFGIGEPGSTDFQEIVVQGGDVMHLPSNVPHSAVAIEDTTVLDVFSPPSEKTGIDKA